MDIAQLTVQARALRVRIQSYAQSGHDSDPGKAAQAKVCEFLRQYGGPRSAFLKQAEAAGGHATYLVPTLASILDSFIEYLEAGLQTGLSPQRQAQIDVVSDILSQAQAMLEGRNYHPAAAAVLIGAALEEFFRNWIE